MGDLTDYLPKPLLPSLENPMIRNQIALLRPHVRQLAITVGYKKHLMYEALESQEIDYFLDVEGHGNAFFLNQVDLSKPDGAMVVITSDNLMDISIPNLWDEISNSEYSHMGVLATSTLLTADFLEVENSRIKGICNRQDVGIICAGLQALKFSDLRTTLYSQIETFHDLWTRMMDIDQLRVSNCEITKWYALDTKDDLDAWVSRG